jgi:hypothetical protein
MLSRFDPAGNWTLKPMSMSTSTFAVHDEVPSEESSSLEETTSEAEDDSYIRYICLSFSTFIKQKDILSILTSDAASYLDSSVMSSFS